MENGWIIALYFSGIAACLGIATSLKIKVRIFQKHLMPTSMLAGTIGFIALQLARYVFGWLDEETLRRIQHELGYLVSHLMAIGFIALALKDRNKKRNTDIVNTGYAIVKTYMVQGIIGLAVSLLLVKFVYPDLFPPLGMMLPLGFAQGPGQAVNVGIKWEEAGFTDGANIGLAIANFGFLWALIGGVPFLNFLLKRVYKNQKKYSIHEVKDMELEKYTKRTISIPKSTHIDDLTIQLLLIGSAYLVTYLLIWGLSQILFPLGTFGETVSEMLWGFNFVIGTVVALVARTFMDKLRVKRVIRHNYADNYLLQRISSAAFDFMITASLAAVSISVLRENLIPILIITTVGGLSMMVYCYYLGKMIYKDEQLEHIIALYGMWTGTITTGIALLREIDPYSKSRVPENLVLGSGFAIFVGFPLMFILALPLQGFKLNQPVYYFWTFVAMIAMDILMTILLYLNRPGKKQKVKN
ncbi:MAG: sodium:glutamate symporter [Clostridiaceae bacterium]|nr:sodium:glutamate symporter [Clostridiaceae bacterium]